MHVTPADATASAPVGEGPYASHSRLHTYLACPRSYQLGYVEHVPRIPGVYMAAGTAVHAAIQRYLEESVSFALKGGQG